MKFGKRTFNIFGLHAMNISMYMANTTSMWMRGLMERSSGRYVNPLNSLNDKNCSVNTGRPRGKTF